MRAAVMLGCQGDHTHEVPVSNRAMNLAWLKNGVQNWIHVAASVWSNLEPWRSHFEEIHDVTNATSAAHTVCYCGNFDNAMAV